jgi:steroid 5-alpha reductase family enzyme
MMTFLELYAYGSLLVLGLMVLLWLFSLLLRNSSIMDIFWGPGFVALVWLYFALAGQGITGPRLLLACIVSVWGLRLGTHILRRNWGKAEDFRYQEWRRKAGRSWWWLSFFRVFLLQGFLMWVISVPLAGAEAHSPMGGAVALSYVATAVWALGFVFEAGGDLQLSRFRADPSNRGKVLDTGLWRLSRHPNYFGDATQWWGFYLFALAAGAWWTVFSPVIMTGLLLRVSGVALIEKTLRETKPAYREYEETTSSFIPWFPRRRA